MILPNIAELESIAAKWRRRWDSPCPSFTSGRDIRTSENALLVLTYGNLVQAAESNWLNAERSLIDKTYITMLQHVQSMSNIRVFNAEAIARALDTFIRTEIKPVWNVLPELNDEQKNELTCQLVEKGASQLFGSLSSEVAASRVLFFLCPMLPVFNFSLVAVQALQPLASDTEINGYASFQKAMSMEYQEIQLVLNDVMPPEASFGQAADQQLVNNMLQQTDWWQRRLFDELLRNNSAGQELFACSADGKLI